MRNDAIEEIEQNANSPIEFLNNQYDSNETIIATFNSLSDVDNFYNIYNHDNKYNGLKLGQRIQINDGTYNETWEIAGFDCEANCISTDGTIKSNGYGIVLSPVNGQVIGGQTKWNSSNNATPYISSTMHTYTLPTIANNLKNVLGDHLINRNVLLSSGIDTSTEGGYTNAYTWTTEYCTIPSIYQITGTYWYKYYYSSSSSDNFWLNANIYDIGEANYRLPLYKFRYYAYGPTTNAWLRTVNYFSDGCKALTISSLGDYSSSPYNITYNLLDKTYQYNRPLIYIR